jgi:predicted GNAT family acetyltransferase
VIDHLLKSEAECCAQIGLVGRMARDAYRPISVDELDQPLLCTVQDGNEIALVAIQTMKTTMIVSRGDPEAIDCLADALAQRRWPGRFLVGVVPCVEQLTMQYAALSGRARSLAVRLRVFQLNSVTWPTPVPGAMRLCDPQDRQILATFIAGFERDIGEVSHEAPLTRADRLIADRRIFFWTDAGGHPVATAGWAGPTPNGIRVNFVYTPPELRGRGYASNLVARLSQRLLDEGRRFCFLFTDLANPVSNSIYQKLGYRMVSDSERWGFGE